MYDGTMYRDGLKGIAFLFAGLLLSLFFGWRRGWDAARAIFLPPSRAEIAMAKADEVLAETRALEDEVDPPAMLARRFLHGEMTVDIAPLGRRAIERLIALRAHAVDVSSWTDQRLLEEMRSPRPSGVVPREVHEAAEAAYDFAGEDGVALAP